VSPILRAICLRAALLGSIGPLVLAPVSVWLDLRSPPPTLEASMWWETIFRYVWPASVLLMAGFGVKPLSIGYLGLLSFAAAANVLLFVVIGAGGGGLYLLFRRVARGAP